MQRLFFATCCIILMACSSAKQITAQPPAEKPLMTVQDESFDFSAITDFSFPVPNGNSFSSVRKVTPEELLALIEEDTAEADEEIDGYRVQLISTRDEEEARAVLRNAVLSFDEKVYREFHDPYYKIRVGDFRSRYEAVLLQEKAISMGFTEAWVVRSKIKKLNLGADKGSGKSDKP